MESRFNNREITAMFDHVDEKFDIITKKLDEHGETHEKILAQVTYTNGKVRKLTLFLIVIASVLGTLVVKDPVKLVTLILGFI